MLLGWPTVWSRTLCGLSRIARRPPWTRRRFWTPYVLGYTVLLDLDFAHILDG